MPASVRPMHDETSNSVTDQANTETSFGQGIDTVDTIDDSLGNEGNLEHEVCCTLQEYDDKFDVGHVVDNGRKMDDDDNGDDGVDGDGDGDVEVVVEDGIVTDDIDVVVDGIDERDIESGKVNDDKDDDEERSLCCRCIV